MSAYYNEIDPYAAQWLRNLIVAGHIAAGDVDERSITDVRPDDLRGYTQCHFFAGIGGWSYAMRLAGWPDDRPVWTGSCPCQPFSAAGKQRGSDDERHLWPTFFGLIRECRPASVFGEQVAGAAGLAWLDHVCADLEGAGYAAAAADLCAAGAGAFHIRQRLYWVAHSNPTGLGEQRQHRVRQDGDTQPRIDADGRGAHGILADVQGRGRGQGGADASGRDEGTRSKRAWLRLADDGGSSVGYTAGEGSQGRLESWPRTDAQRAPSERAGALDAWRDVEWIDCRDGKARPTKPSLFPLAHGVSNRMGRLRAYGNAIVPQVAALFVMAAS